MEKKEESKKANYKLINIRIILSILILINFLTIFGFSEQNGEQSTNLSRNITLDVLNTFGDYNEPLTVEQETHVLNVEHIIRKLAHFTIYTILGILLMCLAVTFDFTNKKTITFKCTNWIFICKPRRVSPKLYSRQNSFSNRCINRYSRCNCWELNCFNMH